MALRVEDFQKGGFELRPTLPGNGSQHLWRGTEAEKYLAENRKRIPSFFSGQYADLTLDQFCHLASKAGCKAVELACWGNGIDVRKAAVDERYCADILKTVAKHGLVLESISSHLVGQAVSDEIIDVRHKGILPPHVWKDGNPAGVRHRASEEMKLTAKAAKNLNVKVVNGFTGSRTWHQEVYDFPPTPAEVLHRGYVQFADDWNPILDVFGDEDRYFALEVHPTEQAFNLHTADKAMRALGDHEHFGFNYDPSHFEHQGIKTGLAARYLLPRIFHVHDKDAEIVEGNGINNAGKYNGGVRFGDPDVGWDFRSLGKGKIALVEVTRALNSTNNPGLMYIGPRAKEWEDGNMDREDGVIESGAHQRTIDFTPSYIAFDAGMAKASETAPADATAPTDATATTDPPVIVSISAEQQ